MCQVVWYAPIVWTSSCARGLRSPWSARAAISSRQQATVHIHIYIYIHIYTDNATKIGQEDWGEGRVSQWKREGHSRSKGKREKARNLFWDQFWPYIQLRAHARKKRFDFPVGLSPSTSDIWHVYLCIHGPLSWIVVFCNSSDKYRFGYNSECGFGCATRLWFRMHYSEAKLVDFAFLLRFWVIVLGVRWQSNHASVPLFCSCPHIFATTQIVAERITVSHNCRYLSWVCRPDPIGDWNDVRSWELLFLRNLFC